MSALVLRNARLLDPGSGLDRHGAVLIEDGRIADIGDGEAGAPEGATVVDARGLPVAPGLIDLRVFTGEPGHEYRETLKSAGEAAAAGGVTSMLVMPDTTPTIDEAALVDYLVRRAEAQCKVRVLPAAAMTRGLAGTELAEYGLLREAGALCVTDGRRSVQSSSVLRSAFTYAGNFTLPVIHHVRDDGLAGAGVMSEGLYASALGLKGIPHEAETVPLARDLQLAALTGVRYHAAQISTGLAVELMQLARDRGSSVSSGAAIASLTLNETDIGSYRTFFKLDPPLRAEAQRQALVEGLRAGLVDTIHSGHDPQDVETKRRPFAEAADGAVGLETLLAAALRLVHAGDIELLPLLATMTINPARLLDLDSGRLARGAPADLIVIDPDYPWLVEEAGLRSRSRNSCFEGARMTGAVMATYVAGREVFRHAGFGGAR